MLNKLLNIGINDSTDPYEKREIRILNLIAFILLGGITLGFSSYFFIKELYPTNFYLFIAICALLILFFNYKKWYTISLYSFVLTINFILIFVSNYYVRSTGTIAYFFPSIFCFALLHNPKKPQYHFLIQCLLIIIGFIISQTIDIPIIDKPMFSPEQVKVLRYYNIYFSLFLTIVLVFLIVQVVNKQYEELNALVKKSEDNQIIIANSLNEKEVLLKEIQHRVKNNLAVMIGLFNFQKENTHNEETKTALNEAKNRVLSIAMVHQKLYGKKNLNSIELDSYITELTQEVLNSHPLYSHTQVNNNTQKLNLDITKAVPIGLIVNEIITNAFKHAFKDEHNKPCLTIELYSVENIGHLTIKDNGRGFPDLSSKSGNSLGHTLIESLSDQIDAKVEFANNDGAQVKLTFPLL